jgi:aryl-alcohol dehydrogenase-like predicted oxidoreductase
MKYRKLGKTGFEVSEVSLGTWQIGASWGSVSEQDAVKLLETAIDKAGRRLQPHTADGYNKKNLTAFVERSLTNLKRDALDLVQLHCPPTDVYYRPEVFEALDALKQAGKLLHYGVSVEKIEEAIKATEFPGIATVQIIFNIFPKARCRNPCPTPLGQRLIGRQNYEANSVRIRRSPQLQSARRAI